jgi:hypothetical protein
MLKVQSLTIGSNQPGNNKNPDRWLRVNAVRCLTVDLAALTTFAIAVSKVFSRSLSHV